tara:strand:+ start:66 stop:371 length:306 start_codon:yes stop_codon:yes gene_type:complete
MKFELSSKSRIEKVIFDKNNFYELLDEYLECDGGVIVKIKDRDMIKKDYIEMGFEENEMIFENEEGDVVGINDVVCKLDIKEGDGGYSVFYDENKNYLIEE